MWHYEAVYFPDEQQIKKQDYWEDQTLVGYENDEW